MVYLSTAGEWQRQSGLLLAARPATARITTKYNIANLESAKYRRCKAKTRDGSAKDEASTTLRGARAVLTLKTYDPESGVVLKFKTDRAADVGRLVAGLGLLGRHMAALPEKRGVEDVAMEDVAPLEVAERRSPVPASEAKAQGQNTSGGGGKKKKKGKK